MRIFNFIQFINESFSLDSENEEIQNFHGDGYSIKVSRIGEEKKPNRICLSEQNPHSYCLNYFDKDGSEIDKIWIPREFLKIAEEGDQITITLHPDNKWISKKDNKIALEDFLEDYLNHRIEFADRDDKNLDEISSDVSTLLEVLNLPLEIEKVEKIGDNQYEVSFKNGCLLDFSKSSPSNLFNLMKFYRNKEDIQPSLSILKKGSDSEFDFHHEDIGKKNFCCQLDEVPLNPYRNYLVRKSVGSETHGDEESLLDFFIQRTSQSPSQINPDLPHTINDKNYLRDLKSVVSSFVPDQKLKNLIPTQL